MNEQINLCFHIKTQEEIEKHVNEFTKLVQNALSDSVPLLDSASSNLPEEIKILIKRKNALRRRYQRTGNKKF